MRNTLISALLAIFTMTSCQNSTLPKAELTAGTCTLKICADETESVTVYLHNHMTGRLETFRADLDSSGTAEMNIPLTCNNQYITIMANNNRTDCLANNGEPLTMRLKDGKWSFSGANANVNTVLATESDKNERQFFDELMSTPTNSSKIFKQTALDLCHKFCAQINSSNYPASAKELMEINIKSLAADIITECKYHMANMNQGDDTQLDIVKDEAFYSFVTELGITDNPQMLYGRMFPITIHRLGLNAEVFMQDILDAMKTDNKLDSIGQLSLSILKDMEATHRHDLTPEEEAALEKFEQEHDAELDEYYDKLRKEKLNKIFGTDDCLAIKLIDMQEIMAMPTNSQQAISQEDLAAIDSLHIDALTAYATWYNSTIQNNGRTEFTTHIDGENEAEKMIVDIVDNHRGKVIMIDLWATWCTPCVRCIEAIKPYKEELKNKGVDIVYITDETSPIDQWEQMTKEMDSEQHRVSTPLMDKIMDLFEVSGMPTYIFINKKGEIDNIGTGFSTIEPLYTQLMEMAEEK